MPDIHDPDEAERLEASNPDALHSRRDFLQRTAAMAGLASGLGLALSPDTVLAQAARAQAQALPAPRNMPIDTFVVLMMENRSFDHYLGWLPGADGRQAGLTFKDANGVSRATHRLTPDFQGLAFQDPDHSWQGGRTQLDGGRNDGFLKTTDTFAIGYYGEPDLPFIPSIAKAFTTYDRFFCSLLSSTYPNRYYMHAAQSYGRVDNAFPFLEAANPVGLPDSTIFAALAAKGIASNYFYTDIPVSALWGAPGLARSAPVSSFYDRAAAGTLPALSFVDPGFNGEEAGTSLDEHPHGDVRAGQAFMSDVVHAMLQSPQWSRTAVFVVYDEWGGFFDHVRPPRVPDVRASRDVNQDFGQMGFRIPAVAISPYVQRGHVDHGIYGFESILKLIRYRYGISALTTRDAAARNIGLSFDFASKPRLDVPDLPTPSAIMRGKVGARARGSDELVRPAEHDLAELHTSGYLDRLGFDYRPATASSTFRHPSSMGLKP